MVGFICSAWLIGLNSAVILSLRQCCNSRYLIFSRLHHQRVNMPHSLGRRGGGTAQVGRLYVTAAVFTAITERNQSSSILRTQKRESNLELQKERMCWRMTGMNEWKIASGFKQLLLLLLISGGFMVLQLVSVYVRVQNYSKEYMIMPRFIMLPTSTTTEKY